MLMPNERFSTSNTAVSNADNACLIIARPGIIFVKKSYLPLIKIKCLKKLSRFKKNVNDTSRKTQRQTICSCVYLMAIWSRSVNAFLYTGFLAILIFRSCIVYNMSDKIIRRILNIRRASRMCNDSSSSSRR